MEETRPQGHDPADSGSRQQFERPKLTMLRSNWPLSLLAAAFLIAVVVGYVYVSSERRQSRDLMAANRSLTTSLSQVQAQLQSVSERLSDVLARTAPASAARTRSRAKVRPAVAASGVRSDERFGKIQSQLSDQQKQIASAREDIDRTKSDLTHSRDDLQNNINSTKDELNGSIARTHDDVVALQKRGERNYYEFAIDKSKQYSRVGPVSVELRKADTKHKRFDLMMLVDDNQLQKKSVNLYETVWISLSDRPQPIELVVNKITKDHIEGYLSEPKYKKSELQSSIQAGSAAKPAGPMRPQ
jgi:hypothetical protein